MRTDELALIDSLPGAALTQNEFDAYLDFIGQYGIGTWRKSTMRREAIAGNYLAACDALLLYRRQGGRDCSLPENAGPKGCAGVWTRQLKRQALCKAATL
jgi:GH24 family phage-related lysozyme (muramidase)